MAEIGKANIKVGLTDDTKQGTQSVITNMDKIEKKSSKISNIFGKAFSDVKLGLFGVGVGSVTKSLISCTKKSSDFIEQLNVLDVAFNNNTKSIREFTSKISDTLNLDDASIIKMASSFKILANSMGYTEQVGTKFSELMTQISVDTASLFNMSLGDTQAMLQSAVQGQTKALRKRTGVSILDRDVQTTLDAMGVDAYVKDMNSAEKSLARVITMSYRLSQSQGDLARTIEAPANQMRVFGEQISLLARNIGNVFLPIVSAMLPYLNAILIVLNKLISSLATLLGFRENAWDTYEEKTDTLKEAFDNFGASVGGVGDAAKKTKKELSGLREFDKLNVIKTPKDTSTSGSGAGGSGGIDPNLLKAFDLIFDKYDSRLDGLETKATKIAKQIMKALGSIDFSNLIASGKRLWEAFKPFAENVGQGLLWTLKNVLVPLGKWTIEEALPRFLDILANCFKVLNKAIEGFKPGAEWLWKKFLSPLAKFTGGVIVKWLDNIKRVLDEISKKKLFSMLTVGGAGFLLLASNLNKFTTAIQKTKTFQMFDNLKKGIGIFSTFKGAIKGANEEFRIQNKIIDENTGKLDKQHGVANAVKTALGGFATATIGLTAVSSAFDDISQNGLNSTNVLGGLAGAIGTVSGAMQIGASIFKNYGLVIGAVVGVIGLAITAFNNFKSSSKEATDSLAEYEKAQKRLDEATREKLNTDLTELEHLSKLSNELDGLVDANGRVKKGYEKRVDFILNELNKAFGTEYKLIDGVITENGKQVQSYQKVADEIKEVIKWKKAEAVAEAYKEDYITALKNEKKYQKEVNKAEDEYSNIQTVILDKYGKKGIAILKNKNLSLEEKAAVLGLTEAEINGDMSELASAKKTYEEKKKLYDKNNKIVKDYEGFQQALFEKNTDATMKYLDKYIDTSEMREQQYLQQLGKNSNEAVKNILSTFKTLPGEKTIKVNVDSKAVSTFIKKIDNAFKNSRVGNFLDNQANIFSSIFKADGGILVNGKWRDIATYDTGGLPPVGQMFVARERGPELVGTIGGNTAVMNNNQIVSSVSSGVAQAVRSVLKGNTGGSGVYNIYLDKDHKLGTYTLEQLQGMAKSNGKPITIG